MIEMTQILSQHDFRFGLMFRNHEWVSPNVTPVTLHQLIKTVLVPSLTGRIALAHQLVVCMLYLHAVDWLHKAIRSDNILFFSHPSSPEFSKAYLSGFSCARPDRSHEPTTDDGLDSWANFTSIPITKA